MVESRKTFKGIISTPRIVMLLKYGDSTDQTTEMDIEGSKRSIPDHDAATLPSVKRAKIS